MSELVVVLSDSEEELARSARSEDDKNDDTDLHLPSVDFLFPDAKYARNGNDQARNEVRETRNMDEPATRIDAAGKSRLSELLGKYTNSTNDDCRSTSRGKEIGGQLNVEKDCVTGSKPGTGEKSPRNLQQKPGESLQSMRVSIDDQLKKFDFHTNLINVLRDSDISCKSESLPIENSIMWMRKAPETENSIENEMIIIWNFDETVEKIQDCSFSSCIENIATLMPDKKLMLILYGTKDYFHNNRGTKQMTKNSLPRISKEDLEICLTEIQLIVGCNSMLIDSAQELSWFVHRMTKAIAEKPAKLAKKQKLEQLDWYAMGDNRDTVKVDKNGNGLRRLWQQQLCQFNLASLETAEAIASVYSSPVQLMHAYKKCSCSEGEKLLGEIPIRRAAGPQSTSRKIGPELSRKIYMTFTSKDGDAALVNDR